MRDALVAAGLWPIDDPRDPSLSIEAAWAVVEHLQKTRSASVTLHSWPMDRGDWHAQFSIENANTDLPGYTESVRASTLPLTICLAALAAVTARESAK